MDNDDRKEAPQPMEPQTPPDSQPRKDPAAEDRSALSKLLRPVQWAVNLVVLVGIVLIFTPVGTWYGHELVVNDDLAKADYIVVLGGDSERAVVGARLYRDGWAKKVIVSSTPWNARGLAAAVRSHGTPGEAIIIDDRSQRTATHPRTIAQAVALRPETDRFILVTSLYHSSRAKACFRRAGYQHVVARVPQWQLARRRTFEEESFITRLRDLPLKTHEYLAWAYYKLRGWL